MRIEGDIKVWIDGDKACARLFADGPEGPIVVHASAPLKPIRREVARAMARKGVNVSGDDPSFVSQVKRLARRKAMRRLQRMAPAAFRNGGLGPYLARKELRKRRRRRRALARAGRPVGNKPIASVTTVPSKALRRWRLLRPVIPRPGLAAGAVAARAALSPVPGSAPSGGGAGGGGGSAPPEGDESDDTESPDEQPDQPDEAEGGNEGDEPEPSEDGDAEADSDTETAEDAADREPADGDADTVGEERVFPARRLYTSLADPRVRAALRLLLAARTNPAARKRVAYIVTMAGAGDPKANKALGAMKVARKAFVAAARRKHAPMPPPTALVPTSTALAPRSAAAQTPLASGSATPSDARWWDLLDLYRKGIG